MNDPVVVAVDVGTSAVRAAAVTASGEEQGHTRVSRQVESAGRTFDAEVLYRQVLQAIRDLRPPHPPAALSITAHIGCVAVDSAVQPVAPGGGWADDRGLAELTTLPEELQVRLLNTSRRPALTSCTAAMALHLARSEARHKVAALLTPKDYLVARLTGVIGMDTIDAAYSLLADPVRNLWQHELAAELDLPASWLPPISTPTSVVGEVNEQAASGSSLPAGTPVVSGAPDGSVGLGLLLGRNQHAIADIAGTTDVLGRLTSDPSTAGQCALVNPSLHENLWMTGGPTGLTGGAAAWWADALGSRPGESLRLSPPGARGLRILPSLSGSRFPRWRPNDTGSLFGHRPGHQEADVVRAALEGAAFVVREGVEVLDRDSQDGSPAPLLLAGGAAKSPEVAQLRADVLGRPVKVAERTDVTLLGAAALALMALQPGRSLDEIRQRLSLSFREVLPDAGMSELYDEAFTDWRQLTGDLD